MNKADYITAAIKTIAKANGRSPSKLTVALKKEAEELGLKNWNDAKAAKSNESKTPSKRERAEKIYLAMTAKGRSRQDVIAAFMDKLEMSKYGAANYYQRFGANGEWAVAA